MTRLARTEVDSPVGPLVVVTSDVGVRAVLWGDEPLVRVARSVASADDVVDDPEHPILRQVATQLGEYFAGSRTEFDLPLDPQGTPFQLSAWTALRSIPFGETVSYGEQARRMGDARKARAVGAANGRNPLSIVVPCHRVVGSDGSLTGFAGGVSTKAWLLDHERAISSRS